MKKCYYLEVMVSQEMCIRDRLTTAIDTALVKVSTQRAKFGAIQNRLEHTIKNVDNTSITLAAILANVIFIPSPEFEMCIRDSLVLLLIYLFLYA